MLDAEASLREPLLAGRSPITGAGRNAEQEQQAYDEPPPDDGQVQAQYAPPPPDPADEIEHLAQLHSSGVLTDQEFSDAKAKVLGT